MNRPASPPAPPPTPASTREPMVRNRAQVNQAALLGAHGQHCPLPYWVLMDKAAHCVWRSIAISLGSGHLEGQTHTEGRKEFAQKELIPKGTKTYSRAKS